MAPTGNNGLPITTTTEEIEGNFNLDLEDYEECGGRIKWVSELLICSKTFFSFNIFISLLDFKFLVSIDIVVKNRFIFTDIK